MKQLGGSGKASSSSSSSAEKLKDIRSPQPSIWKRFLFVDGLCSCQCCHFRVLHLQVQDSALGCKLDGFGNKIYRLRDFYNLIYIYYIYIIYILYIYYIYILYIYILYIYWRKAAVAGDVKWCLAIFLIFSWDLRPPWAPPERKLQALWLRAAGNVLCAHAAAHETDPQQS